MIVKPSPFTPYSILKLAEIARDVVPRGVFQALNGNNTLGESMTAHPGIDKISFTGSTTTGKKIMESASRTLKRITLELGGNDATIVCPDVDVKKVVPEVASGCFFNAGQMCVATKRVYVHEAVFDEFLREFVESVKAFSLKNLPILHPIFGPIQNQMQHAIVQDLVRDCKSQGYRIAAGGDTGTPGLFIEPTVVDNPPDESRVVQDEQFGEIYNLLSFNLIFSLLFLVVCPSNTFLQVLSFRYCLGKMKTKWCSVRMTPMQDSVHVFGPKTSITPSVLVGDLRLGRCGSTVMRSHTQRDIFPVIKRAVSAANGGGKGFYHTATRRRCIFINKCFNYILTCCSSVLIHQS